MALEKAPGKGGWHWKKHLEDGDLCLLPHIQGLLQGDRQKKNQGHRGWGSKGTVCGVGKEPRAGSSLSGLAAGTVAAVPTAQGGQRELEQGQGGTGQDKGPPQKAADVLPQLGVGGQQEGTGEWDRLKFSPG